ncbi:MAG: hypothetical protein HY716_10050 [Planctomycetes bacterium]|nr:hypothetical protein [Planctomycetota bacterium]
MPPKNQVPLVINVTCSARADEYAWRSAQDRFILVDENTAPELIAPRT